MDERTGLVRSKISNWPMGMNLITEPHSRQIWSFSMIWWRASSSWISIECMWTADRETPKARMAEKSITKSGLCLIIWQFNYCEDNLRLKCVLNIHWYTQQIQNYLNFFTIVNCIHSLTTMSSENSIDLSLCLWEHSIFLNGPVYHSSCCCTSLLLGEIAT